jgi:lipoate-protein ligase A
MDDGGDAPCFVSPSRYELMVDGRKIVGSAQRRVRRSFLQHGSMPITCNREVLARVTRLPDTELLEKEMAGVAEFLPHRPRLEEFRSAFVRAFQDYFDVELTSSIQHSVELPEKRTQRVENEKRSEAGI